MTQRAESSNPGEQAPALDPVRRNAIFPQLFSSTSPCEAADVYLADPPVRKLADFFQAMGLKAIKQQDQEERWYQDWIAYQAKHRLYASLLSAKQYSTLGNEFDILRLARFLEVFAFFSPSHGYSLQVTFLGLFSILMGSNAALKKEATAALEAGELFAFGVSEKAHGSDLLANEFIVKSSGNERFIADGKKYYIGNANVAGMISIFARKEDERSAGRSRRALPILFALRPRQSNGFGNVRKIGTLGIRAAFVGEFELKNHELPQMDIIAQGRQAWDAVLGTVTLGKFFLGFGSIGICEGALAEALAHLAERILYDKPVVELPHIGLAVAQAYARLTAMKLYAYRAVDYVHSASETDRRYLLLAAVQKARVSTEGVKVIAQLSECIGAKGFESDTYFEMALRDIQLIPALEGSSHINLGMIAQFVGNYFGPADAQVSPPSSLFAGKEMPGENSYLMEARTGAVNTAAFAHYLDAYRPLLSIANVRIFVRQAKAFRLFVRSSQCLNSIKQDTRIALAIGQCLAAIAYAQLVAEHATLLQISSPLISAMFHLLVNDLTQSAPALASNSELDSVSQVLIQRLIQIPKTTSEQWNFVLEKAIGK